MAAEARDLAPTDSRKNDDLAFTYTDPARPVVTKQTSWLPKRLLLPLRPLAPRGGQPHWRAEALAAETPGRESEFVDDLLRREEREEAVEW